MSIGSLRSSWVKEPEKKDSIDVSLNSSNLIMTKLHTMQLGLKSYQIINVDYVHLYSK